MVSAGLQVDILPISRLFLVQRLLNEELDHLMEVFFQAAILRGRYWHSCIHKLWKVLMMHLLPGCFVMALEHVFKLHKGVWPVKVTFFSSLIEFRDRFVNGKFDTILSVILVDFDAIFVSQIVALSL
jgi:hypothetical protein